MAETAVLMFFYIRLHASSRISMRNRLVYHVWSSRTYSVQALHKHACQSLACETAINTDFSELFSLKRIYVKYKNAILSLIDGFFRT